MKIEHEPDSMTFGIFDGYDYGGLDLHASPHECSVPDCPGNRNRLKLELFEEMLGALSELTSWVRAYASISQPNDDARFTRMCSENDKAEEIVRKAKELK